jgi:hypothetical protein
MTFNHFASLCENLYHMDELDNMDQIINTKKSLIAWKKQIMFVRLIKHIALLKICCGNLINHARVKLWWHWWNWVNWWNQPHRCYWPCRWIQTYECWQFSYMNGTYHFFLLNFVPCSTSYHPWIVKFVDMVNFDWCSLSTMCNFADVSNFMNIDSFMWMIEFCMTSWFHPCCRNSPLCN